MGVEIDGIQFFTLQDVAGEVGVSRQTLWRWRRSGKIPAGHRYRNGQVLYSEAELQAINAYARYLEPVAMESN